MHIKCNTVAKGNFKMSKKVKHASLLDFFMPKAKKSKENPLEDSNEDTDLQADNCVLQQTNDSNKQINEINSDVSHASLDTGRGEDIEMIETNESDSSETENDHRKFDGNLETMENDLSESSSVGLPNANLNASNEIPNSCEHSSQSIHSIAPSCWSVKQQDYFTSAYPWIIFSNGKIGCRECKNVNTLGLHAKQRSHISKEWIECTVFPCKTKSRETSAAQKYLRKNITKHAKSNAHVTATNILKERQKRKIQSSTGLSVAQHQSATEKCLRTAYYVAKENRPYSDYENLVKLQQKNGISLEVILHSRWSCT